MVLDQIIGHKELIERISPRIEKHSAGVYLLYGPPSVGKRTIAFEISKCILCKNKSGNKCVCDSCKRFYTGHPDFMSVGSSERVKVADVDRILDFCTTTPFLSDKKIIVIDNAHEMTIEAANRLLKILEEPPLNYSFFLITSNPQGIIPTVLSRCIKYSFGSLTQEELSLIIRKKLGFTSKKAEILSMLAVNSSMDIFNQAGQYVKCRDMAIEFLSGIKSRHFVDSLDYVDKIERENLPIFCDMVVLILTDLILIKNDVPNITNIDKKDGLVKIAESYNDRALVGVVSLFSQVKRYLYLNINLNLYFKNTLIKTYPFFMAN